jgi:hypothetical protein
MVSAEILHEGPGLFLGPPALLVALIHRSAWNKNSRKLRQAFIAWGCEPMYGVCVAKYAHPCVR